MGDFDDINVKINVDASGAEQGLTRVSTSLNKLNSDVGKLGTGADFGDKLNSESKQAEGGLDKLGEAAEQANQKLAKVGSGLNLSAVGSQLDALSGKMQAWGAGLSILAAPFELVGAASVNAFVDFEAGMGKIFTLLPDITDQAMSEMSSQIKEFSTTFGADLSTIQQAAYDALSSGVSQADLMPFLETAQTAAVAGMSDVGTAVDGLTSVINAYQMELDDAGRVSDVFFKTVELGKIEFGQLAANIGKVAPTAAQFKIGFEDVGAAIASITSQGLKPQQTMTVLTSLISQLGKSGTDLSDKFKEITGQSFPDFIASGGTLADAIGKIRDYSQDTGTSLMDMTGNLEAAKGMAMLGGSAFDQYAGFLDKISDSAGSTESAYSKMSDTMAFALDKLKAQFQVMSVDIGEKLAPVVLEFTQWLTENADQISDFAQNVASAAVPAIESIFNTLQKGMDMYEKMSPETKAMLAKLIGVGAVGAAVAGPGLLIGGTALSPVASLITMMGNLQASSVMAKASMGGVSAEAGLIAGSSGAAASGLGGISTALAGIGPLGWAAAAALAAAGAAYVTNFGGFRDNINDAVKEAESAIKNFNTRNYEDAGRDAAEAMAKGLGSFGELVVDAIGAAPGAFEAADKFMIEFGNGLNQSAESYSYETTKIIISALDSGLKSGADMLTGVGDAITTAINGGIDVSKIAGDLITNLSKINLESAGLAMGESVLNGMLKTKFGLFGDLVESSMKGTIGALVDSMQDDVAEELGVAKEDVQKSLSRVPFIGGILGGDYGTTPSTTSTGLGLANKPGWVDPHFAYASYQENKALLSDASDVISKLAEERDISYESAKKMYDSSENLRKSLETKYADQPAGTPTDPIITAPASTTPSKLVDTTTASIAAPIVYERPSADIPDLFTKDPAKYIEQELKSILEGGFDGSIAAYEDYLSEFGMDLEDKGRQIFEDAKSKGLGGGVDWDDWWSEVQAGLPISIASLQNSFKGLESVFQTLEKTISDGSASSSEAERYLDEYNKSTGKTTEYTQKQISQTKDLMNAYSSISNAQDLYNKYMDDGKLSTEEATTVQAALAQGIDLMGTAGADTADKIAGLPPALQELASSIMDFFNQIKASVTQAQQDSMYDDGWRTATNSGYESMIDPKTGKPVQRSYLDIDVILGLKEGPAKVDSLTESNKALQNSMHANVGTTNLLASAYQTAGDVAVNTMNRVTDVAASAVARAESTIAAAQSAIRGASNYMPGMTETSSLMGGRQMFDGFNNGFRNPSPCASPWLLQQEQNWYNNRFASGGRVAETGPALVHEGEYILSRNEVNNMSKGGTDITLNVNMNNSRFGNTEMAKDLPRMFAKATKRAFISRGFV